VDKGTNLRQIQAASCTEIYALAQNSSSPTFVKRDNLIVNDKNDAEGAPEELKICLGWTLDSRRLLVSLPFHKYKAQDSQIENSTVSVDILSTVIERLENVAIMISMFGHFLNNIGHL
jgi:hypothetical protein